MHSAKIENIQQEPTDPGYPKSMLKHVQIKTLYVFYSCLFIKIKTFLLFSSSDKINKSNNFG